MRRAVLFAALGLFVSPLVAQGPPEYDFLIKGGRVVDPRNSLDGVRDVAIKDGKIAAVSADISAAARSRPSMPRPGRHPGPHRPPRARLPGRKAEGLRRRRLERLPRRLHPAKLRDHGHRRRHVGLAQLPRLQAPHHRPVEDPRHRVPQHRRQRHGIGPIEQNAEDMDVAADGQDGDRTQGRDRGIKSAHYNGPNGRPTNRRTSSGTGRHPRDGRLRRQRAASRRSTDLFTKYLRPGDIFTHMYGGVRGEQDPETSAEPGDGRGPQARHLLRRRPRRDELSLLGRVPLMKAGFLPTRSRPTSTPAA